VAAVRRGTSRRAVAIRFGVALCTVQRWFQRAQGQRLNRVDWNDRSSAPHRTRCTKGSCEQEVLTVRRRLKDHSPLGEFGAAAIRREMETRGTAPLLSISTIGRILRRHGILDGRRRVRRPPPPRGWYLPAVAATKAELDSFDTIEGLAIRGGPHVAVLTGISLHGGLPATWTAQAVSAKMVVNALVEHWRSVGLPAYAQFDNDNRFHGPRQYADTVGRVIRLCLSLGVTPVFAPPNETGFQAAIESYNGRWQAKVWSRFQHASIRGLSRRSAKYIAAARKRGSARIEAAPRRRSFPKHWRLDLQRAPRGRIVFLRRTDDRGRASLLGHAFAVDRHWLHRLVRAEVNLDDDTIGFFALRRREPTDQPLLNKVSYTLPKRPFQE
jgi:transposase